MNNVSYQVKNIDYEKQIMTIANMAYINIDDSCSYLSINTSFDYSLFDYTGNDHNLTYYGCSIPLNWSSSGFYELCNTGNYYYFIAVAVDVFDPLGYDYCDSRYNVSIGKPYSMDDFSMDGLKKALEEGFDVMWKPGKNWCDKCVRSALPLAGWYLLRLRCSFLLRGLNRTVMKIFSSFAFGPPGVDMGVLSIFEAGVLGVLTVILVKDALNKTRLL
ncbi:hypothetical protein QJS10_CPB14g00447 [Acorus calamus]|uniref:Uncharacterized protein n=1 Tax=Acorus calamus TaxID=4465 RepID=A0AAV9DAN1_ACOCL|nr:hypothetical protein QJS10_CPB14g00447 [Acorus calamus]